MERNFKMAYMIQVHKNPNQINDLIEELEDEDTDFYIHIDRKSNIENSIIKLKNIYVIKNRIFVEWGGESQIEATLELMNSIKNSNKQYDYVHLISGQDFPIRNRWEIREFFYNNRGFEFIENSIMPSMYRSRVEVYFPKFLIGRRFVIQRIRGIYKTLIQQTKIFRRNLSYMPEFYYGSSWFSITYGCMKYILQYISENPKFYKFFKNSYCGD